MKPLTRLNKPVAPIPSMSKSPTARRAAPSPQAPIPPRPRGARTFARIRGVLALAAFGLACLVLPSCSLICLELSSVASPNASEDDDTEGKIATLDLDLTVSASSVILSWTDYVIERDDGDCVTPSSYGILRSETDPWSGFTRLKTVSNGTRKDDPERLTWTDSNPPQTPGRWFYRVTCSYTDHSGDSAQAVKILSEAAEARR